MEANIQQELPVEQPIPVPFEFGIRSIHDFGFNLDPRTTLPTNIFIRYGLDLSFDSKLENSYFTVNAIFIDAENEGELMRATVRTVFYIKDLSKFEQNSGFYNFPDGMMPLLFGISFTHLRAIFSKNIAGSIYGSIILPVIDPNQVYADLMSRALAEIKQ